MKCSLKICRKQITSTEQKRKCVRCPFVFCSQSCLNYHYTLAHEPESPFIIKGKFITNPLPQKDFDLENFDMDSREKIGKGAFGDLFSIKHKPTGKIYAIKIINKQGVLDADANLEIIKSEIAIHSRIEHPFIVKLHSFSEDEINFYMIMDYISQGNLFKVIKNSKGLNEDFAFKYFIQICSAIQFLHRNGYVHRDIKPENILIGEDFNSKLCDFGWCVDVTQSERKTFCGTFEYMAPEIVNEQNYNYSIDVWSLGVLLFEMTHGYSPFVGTKGKAKNMNDIFSNINQRNFEIKAKISEECKDLIQKLLTIDSNKRIKINEIFEHPWVQKFESKYGSSFDKFKKEYETFPAPPKEKEINNKNQKKEKSTKKQTQSKLKKESENTKTFDEKKIKSGQSMTNRKPIKKIYEDDDDDDDINIHLDEENNKKNKINRNNTSKKITTPLNDISTPQGNEEEPRSQRKIKKKKNNFDDEDELNVIMRGVDDYNEKTFEELTKSSKFSINNKFYY